MVRYIWAPYRALELALLERYSEKYSAWATAAESTDREVVHLISTMMMMMIIIIIITENLFLTSSGHSICQFAEGLVFSN